MAGLKEIRSRIASIKTTRQVTSAMKMVSAAKLKKAQDAIIHFRPYAIKLHEIMESLGYDPENLVESPFLVQREPEKVLVVLISSNRGLCGGFNVNVTKSAVELAFSTYKAQFKTGNIDFLAIGKQGERQLKNAGLKISGNRNNIHDHVTFDRVAEIASELMDYYLTGIYDRIDLVYNEFINAVIHQQVIEQFLPVKMSIGADEKHYDHFIYEPSKAEIFRDLIPLSLKSQFYKAILDSFAAEHGARMTAMHMATDNATGLISELTLQYNKERQSAITKEILEITGGAEALRNK